LDALNILVVIGSPRNEESWTYKFVRLIETAMSELTAVDFEYIFLEKRVSFL
jgi:hypothetical protein